MKLLMWLAEPCANLRLESASLVVRAKLSIDVDIPPGLRPLGDRGMPARLFERQHAFEGDARPPGSLLIDRDLIDYFAIEQGFEHPG